MRYPFTSPAGADVFAPAPDGCREGRADGGDDVASGPEVRGSVVRGDGGGAARWVEDDTGSRPASPVPSGAGAVPVPPAAGPGAVEWRTVPPMASVLVVEDDQFVRSALIRHLSEAAHTVRSVGTALEALREVAHHGFDVVVLDLGLPDLDGAEALKMLRSITDVPVIIATARDDESEIVRLLNDGADDYLTKPFSVEHLSARMAAVLRRSRASGGEAPPPRVIRVGGLAIDPLRRQAELDGTAIDLTRREFDLLTFLAGRPGVVVPRKELLAEVWQQSYGDDQTIDVHLSWLRRKLGETAARPRYLHTLRGVGVKLQPPAPEPPA